MTKETLNLLVLLVLFVGISGFVFFKVTPMSDDPNDCHWADGRITGCSELAAAYLLDGVKQSLMAQGFNEETARALAQPGMTVQDLVQAGLKHRQCPSAETAPQDCVERGHVAPDSPQAP